MGKNTNAGYRIGVTLNRTQVFNPKTEQFIKRDKSTGQFISAKGTPYKNVRKEK